MIPFVDHGSLTPHLVDVVGETRNLRTRALDLARGGAAEDRNLANAYCEYATLLLHVYEAFLDRVSRQT